MRSDAGVRQPSPRSAAEDGAGEQRDDEHRRERRGDGDEGGGDQQARVAAAAHPLALSTSVNEYGAPRMGVTSNVTPQLPTIRSGMPFVRYRPGRTSRSA